eukprot:TRINITY_DN960_c1_g1_i1.p1 TRINITY_DN960_c1_g1~~TRINITY_DN960_c1_g1_i1.p1  ORF type:complete len:218 (+),score=75.62 TRINITY_DN960_c1_g1_i1:68-655(+)
MANSITLQGSTAIVKEFFYYSVNNLLYQRGIYPPDEFERVKQYGLPLLVSKQKQVKQFIHNALNQSEEWLLSNDIKKIVVVFTSIDTGKTLERWSFDILFDQDVAASGSTKDEKTIRSEIQNIIRQMTSSITFLPIIEEPASFDLLVYTAKETTTPSAWEESDPKLISNAEHVELRSFDTKIHKVQSMVAYAMDS